MVIGFIVFWPIGLAILAYLIWSGRMGCGRYGDIDEWRNRAHQSVERAAERWENKRQRWDERMQRWSQYGGRHRHNGLRPSGNRAFDEYRAEALNKLEEEANEFRDFLGRLRMAKDRAEFDEFMRERRNRQASGPAPGSDAPPQT
jgi:hypothetical protein